jgi:flagellar hook-length control protein FliK
VLQPAEANRIAPAAQVFAAAIQQVVREERRPAAAEQAIVAIAPTTDLAAHAVTAAESSRHAALDMARDTWPAKMIERIEMLRDAANANDTSIRLVPDRLGTIDVSLRRDGDTVAVHFQAQHADTRQLIAEAQPRLADMAEARGLRLSTQTSDGGSHPQQQQQRAGTGTAPTNNVSPDAAQTGASSADERVA